MDVNPPSTVWLLMLDHQISSWGQSKFCKWYNHIACGDYLMILKSIWVRSCFSTKSTLILAVLRVRRPAEQAKHLLIVGYGCVQTRQIYANGSGVCICAESVGKVITVESLSEGLAATLRSISHTIWKSSKSDSRILTYAIENIRGQLNMQK